MVKTFFDKFTVTTDPTDSGNSWGSQHWTFTVKAKESGATHSNVFSAGSGVKFTDDKDLHTSILGSLAMDADSADDGEGNIITQLESLEGIGFELADGYRVALELVKLNAFVSVLSPSERDNLHTFE